MSEGAEQGETGNGPASGREPEFLLFSYPGHLVRRLQQAAVALFHEEMAACGADITPVQYAALVAIRSYPGIDQISLAGVIGYDRTTIGGVVDRLEAKDLIRRSVSPTDRRVRLLDIQAKGAAVLDSIAPHVEAMQHKLVAPLDPEERETFMTLMRKLVDANNKASRAPMRPMPSSRP